MYEFYGLANSGLVTAALLSIRNLLHSNQEVKQSHKMMLIHLIIFNIYAVTLLVAWVLEFGFYRGDSIMTFFKFAMTFDSFVFA